jgi:hypothetical protein
MMEFYDDPKFQQAAMEATRRANYSKRKQRIYRAYGVYCVRPADVDWGGEHVSYVEPDKAYMFYCPHGYGECENANGCCYPGRCSRGVQS